MKHFYIKIFTIKKEKIIQAFFIGFLLVFTNLSFASENNHNINYDIDYDDEYDTEEDTQILQVYDPFEPFNRKMFTLNLKLNDYILNPTNKIYRKITTKGLRSSFSNFVDNFAMPLSFANYVLQLDFNNSVKSFASFTVNTIIGFLGFFDVASTIGLKPEKTNFNYTLGKYGVGNGPYIVLPFFGLATLRSIIGMGLDAAFDPFVFDITRVASGDGKLLNLETKLIIGSVDFLDISEKVQDLIPMLEKSFDPYVFSRNSYIQLQNYKVNKLKGN